MYVMIRDMCVRQSCFGQLYVEVDGIDVGGNFGSRLVSQSRSSSTASNLGSNLIIQSRSSSTPSRAQRKIFAINTRGPFILVLRIIIVAS